MHVGILHPGLMGETLAANCSGQTMWVADGRSAETRQRAQQNDITEIATLAELCERADMIVAICPPAAAVELAADVANLGYEQLYIDANAISPGAARAIGRAFEHFVDGSVIGPPAHAPGTTRLYLSGERATEVAALFRGSALDARTLNGDVGAASALKMAYASWTKIGAAMQLAIRALASAEGVDEALVEEWALSQQGLVDRSERAARGVAPKAWRFTGEMEQIADAFASAGLPTGFADGANDIYRRLAAFKGVDAVQVGAQMLDQVIDTLLAVPGAENQVDVESASD